MGAEKIVDLLLLSLTALLFVAMATAILVPPRRQDALSLSLVAMKLSLAMLFGIASLQLVRVVRAPLPEPALWALRAALIASEVAVFVSLVRAGGFRRDAP